MFSRVFRWVPPLACLLRDRCKIFLLLHLICTLPGHQIQVRAHYCYVGQERDGNNNWRWVLPYEDPCGCTSVRFGGLNTDTPVRPFHPVYVDEPLVSDDIDEIRDHFGLKCKESQSPEVICPANQTVDTDSGQSTAMVMWTAPILINSDASEVSIDTCVPVTGSNFAIGQTKVTCKAMSNNHGKEAKCHFYISVIDKEKPMIVSCPPNQTKETELGQSAAIVAWEGPTATDNSGEAFNVVCVPRSGSDFTIGQIEVECEAADSSGNKAICSFYVNITDKEQPKIKSCPTNITMETDLGQPRAIVVWEGPTATDNSGEAVNVVCVPTSESNFTIGQTEVKCEAADSSENKATCVFLVNITDKEPPKINSCSTNLTKETNLGKPTATVEWEGPTATDNSEEEVNVVCVPTSGSNFTIGQTEVECEAADSSENNATCSFPVNITDTEAPALTCPSDINMVASNGTRRVMVTWPAPQVKDNSGLPPIRVWCSRDNGTQVQIGRHNFHYYAKDTSGNIGNCRFRVTIDDEEPPVISCPSTMSEITSPGQNSNFVFWNIDNMASDNDVNPPDRNVTVQCTPLSGSVFQMGRTNVTCTAYDHSGNSATCSFEVEMKDMEAPELTCPSNIDMVVRNGTRTGMVTWSSPQVNDNSGLPPINVWCSGDNGTEVQIGGRSYYYYANDTSGNVGNCRFRVTLNDEEPPVIGCPSPLSKVTLPVQKSNFISWNIDNMASDNDVNPPDRVVAVQCTPLSGSLFQLGRTVVNCTAYDYSENSASCSFEVDIITDSECYVMSVGEDYRGYKSTTENGLTCQNWMSHSPHSHGYITHDSYPYAGLGDHNFCRNPVHESKPWCYTTDSNKQFELCNVIQPQTSCLVCVDPLGMEDGRIQDDQITSSSEWSAIFGAINARLNQLDEGGKSWTPGNNDLNPWIQVDLSVSKIVSGIVLQGRADADQWVTKYIVNCSDDGISWLSADSVNTEDGMVFTGNSDRNTPVIGWFASNVRASVIRILPIDKKSHFSLRFEILGCEDAEWQMVFKAVAGVSTPDPYELWMSTEVSQFRPYYSPTCQHPPPSNTVAPHCKTYNVLDWENLDIQEVKISLFDTSGVVLLNIRFNATGSTSNNWMTKDRVISSPFTDIASAEYFSVEGFKDDYVIRRFYMAFHINCPGDGGWLAMITKDSACEWGRKHIQLPVFLYSKLSTSVNWNVGYDAGLGNADVFAIFIKTKIKVDGDSK